MTSHTFPLIAFTLSLVFLAVRLVTKEKRDFIISVFFIVIGSAIMTFNLQFSTLYYFLWAIVISFVGDLLMAQWIRITDQRTIDGIMAFGIAHIIYILAFNQLNLGGFVFLEDWYLVLIGLVVGIFIFRLVGTGDELHTAIKVSNGLYALLITSMMVVVFAFVLTSTTPLLVKLTAGLGVLLFVASDSILAYNEFQKEIPHAKDIIAVTYVLAQILLQVSPLLTLS